MKILLAALNSKFVHTNLALRYLSFSINKEFDAELKEFTINEELFKILAGIIEAKADIIAFSCYIWNIAYVLEICKAVKQVNPCSKIILGGPEVSHDASELMSEQEFIDFIILGEGEESFPKLIKHIDSGSGGIDDITGIVYRKADRTVKITGNPSVIKDLAAVPSPFQGDLSEYRKKIAYFETARGCPYNCSYCLSSITKGVRVFPMERIKGDLTKLIDSGAKKVKFVDRTFNADKKRALEIWSFLLHNKKETTFHFELSGHLIDDEMIDFLAEIPDGYFQFEIGVQSTCERTIEAINRKTDFSKLSYAVRRLREKNNIHLHLDLIAGLPYETYKSFRESFDDVYNLKPHVLQIGFLKLLKGSQIRKEHDIYGYKFLNVPPYEVLENEFITFCEIIRLKRIEEVVEVYKNSERFENALNFIIENAYKSPFEFFEKLMEFWLKNQAFERKIGAEEAYDLLAGFYMQSKLGKEDEFREVLKLDYIANFSGGSLRVWQKRYTAKDMKGMIRSILSNEAFILEYIPDLQEMSFAEKLKNLHFEVFSFDAINHCAGKPVLIMFKFKKDKFDFKRVKYFKIDSEYFNAEEVFEIHHSK